MRKLLIRAVLVSKSKVTTKFMEDVSKDSTSGDNRSSKEGNTEMSAKKEVQVQSEMKGGCSKNGEDERKLETEPKDSESIVNAERESIYAHCRSILPKRQRGSSRLARCNVCNVEKSVYWPTGIVSHRDVLRHALSHLGRTIYSCRHCEFRSNRIEGHLKTVHGIKNPVGHFEEDISQYANEIKDMITKCFGKHGDSNVTAASSELRREGSTKLISSTSSFCANVASSSSSSVRSSNGVPGRKIIKGKRSILRPGRALGLAGIRQDLCWRLIRNAQNVDSIPCKKCGRELSIKNTYYTGPASLRHHIQSAKHLAKPMYRCGLCQVDCNSYYSLIRHFKSKHRGVSLTNNYENRENDYHDEIMHELSTCFGMGDSQDGIETDGGEGSRPNTTKTDSAHGNGKSLKRKAEGQDGQLKRARLDELSAQSAVMSETSSKSAEEDVGTKHNNSQDARSIRRKIHRCSVCDRSFGYQLILEIHKQVFHSGHSK